jgi:copper oxidase (laccase) domain-containing protein
MEKLGARRKNTFAAIGPCIRQASYEVGSELRNIFVSRSYESSRHFAPSVNTGLFMFDLAAFVLDSLNAAGVGIVDDTKHDTYKDESLFFSYRRAAHQEEANYGRGISLIALEEI